MAASAKLPIFQAHKARRALVPGCGRGYDAWLFAQHGYDTVGVEISGSAVREAKKWVGQQQKLQSKAAAPCDFILADFFADEWLKVLDIQPKGGFELVYDYAVRECDACRTLNPRADAHAVFGGHEPDKEKGLGQPDGTIDHAWNRSAGVP